MAAVVGGRQPGYVTQTVAVGTLEKVVTALGSVQPKDYGMSAPRCRGSCVRLHVQIGDTVQKGQLLAEWTPPCTPRGWRRIKGQFARFAGAARAPGLGVAAGRGTEKRTRELLALSAASQDAVDMADAAAAQARATLESLAAQIDKAQSTLAGDEANLGYTKIYAPMDGVVVSQPVFKGQTVNSAQQAPTLMRWPIWM